MSEPMCDGNGECFRLQAQLDEARATVKRLNRRCQLAEAAANLKVEEWDKRSKGQGRSYVFELGREVGARDGVRAFVERVNARAEAEMLAGKPVTGAHHRAIETELVKLRDA